MTTTLMLLIANKGICIIDDESSQLACFNRNALDFCKPMGHPAFSVFEEVMCGTNYYNFATIKNNNTFLKVL